MLDTNILVDFALIEGRKNNQEPLTEPLRKSKSLLNLYLERRFHNCYTNWNICEFKDVFTRLVEEKKLIGHGYHIHEFSEARKLLPLTNEELTEVSLVVERTLKFSSNYPPTFDRNEAEELLALVARGFST